MTRRAAVVGGPADGASVVLAGPYRFIDPQTGRGYTEGGEGRALYRLSGDVYDFAGYWARRCRGCGAMLLRLDEKFSQLIDSPHRCPLCGHEEEVANASSTAEA